MAEDKELIYAVTRVHMHEANLLGKKDFDQLLSADSVAEAFRLLADKGWGNSEIPAGDMEALIEAETRKTWDLTAELVGNVEPFNVFRYANDYHNLKAAIKLGYSAVGESEWVRYFLPAGTVEVEAIQKAARERDFSFLPPAMAEAGSTACEVLSRTGNGQLCDITIDRAALMAIGAAGKSAKSPLLRRYAEIIVDTANVKSAVRCLRMRKSREFIERALAPAGTLDYTALADAAVSGEKEAMAALLGGTAYADAIPALNESIAAFECWCDNEIIRMIRPCRAQYFGIDPLAAFILGRENEIRMVRLILTVKTNNMSGSALEERLRETYV